MKPPLLLFCLILVACLPQTEFISDGHYSIQHTYTRNFWVQNVSHVTRCLKSEVQDGGCKATDLRQETRLETTQAPGPQITAAGIHGLAFLGSAAILMHGLQTQNVSSGTNFNQAQTSSTLSNGPVTIHRVP